MARIKSSMAAKAGTKISGNAVIEIIDNVIKLANSLVNAYKDIKVEQERTLQFKMQLDSDLDCEKEHTQQVKIQETNKTIRIISEIEGNLKALKLEHEVKIKELEANREKEHEDFLLKDKIASKLIEPLDILMEQWKNANDNIFAIIEEDYCDSSKLEKTKNHLNVIGNQMSNMMATLISFTKSDAH